MFHSTKRLMADSSTSSAECGPIHSAACGFRGGTRIRKTWSRPRWEASCWDTSGAVTQGDERTSHNTSGPGTPSVGPAQGADRKGAPLRFACGDLFLGAHLGLLVSSGEQDHPGVEPLEPHQ